MNGGFNDGSLVPNAWAPGMIVMPTAVLGFLLCFATTAASRADEVKVFLLGGQSNMLGRAPVSGLPPALQLPQTDVLFFGGSDGTVGTTLTTLRPDGKNADEFGPEVTFGRAIADASPTTRFALIKYAAGGTALYNDWAPGTGSQYTAFRNTVSAGIAALQAAGHTTEIVGMLWHQGESDAIEGRQAAYAGNLAAFIADIRANYGADLPFLIGEIRRSNGAAFVTVADAQAAVAAADPRTAFVPASDLAFLDTYHFNAASQITLGQRFAAGYAALVDDEPWDTFGAYISDAAFGIHFENQGFDDDPDGDQIANGLEAWFGTHPGEPDPGMAGMATDGTTSRFAHPQNVMTLGDIRGFYEWSANLADWYAGDGVDGPPSGATVTITTHTENGTTTVTATSSEAAGSVFFRIGAVKE